MACGCAAGASARVVEDRGALRGARVRGRRRRAGLVVVRLVAGLRGMVQRSLLPAARGDRHQRQREREAQHPAAADVSGSRRRRGLAHDPSMKIRVEAVSRYGSGFVPSSRSGVPISSMHAQMPRFEAGPQGGDSTRTRPTCQATLRLHDNPRHRPAPGSGLSTLPVEARMSGPRHPGTARSGARSSRSGRSQLARSTNGRPDRPPYRSSGLLEEPETRSRSRLSTLITAYSRTRRRSPGRRTRSASTRSRCARPRNTVPGG